MIRALGAALVAFGALWAGWRAVEELRGRVRAAEAVIDGLELLERELWERGTALPELLEDLSSRTREPASALFSRCARACRELDRAPFGDSWRRLTPEGRAALLPLGEVLGRYEADGQRAALKRAEEALERERERAEKERDRMGRVYQTLSLAGGAFLVILLL